MAYFTLHAYDADVWIPSFAGLRQSEEIATDTRYAMEAENVETTRGVLQPMAEPTVLDSTFAAKIETLARFHRRWYTGSGSKDWLVIASGGKLFYAQDDAIAWTELGYPTGVTEWKKNVWSFVTYEINPAGSTAPVDVILLSNDEDGLIMVVPPYEATVPNTDWKVELVDTRADPTKGTAADGPKFGVIERYAERIWGGAIPDDPDMLVYSRPYDPTDWTVEQQNWDTPGEEEEEPEDVGGSIQQPSWDGDSFTGLKSFGSQLIAFKQHRVWRILGTDPGEYTFKEQYGGGTAYPNTVAVDTERILMAEREGISVYDGLAVNPFNRYYIEDIWRRVGHFDQMCGILFQKRYYLAVPLDGESGNNALIVYNIEEGTFLLYTDIYIESMMATDSKLFATSSTYPGRLMIINYDSWETGSCSGNATRWVTPWMDFSRKSMAKGGYEIYFNPEVRNGPVTFQFSIESEKKVKSKNVVIESTIDKAKQKRVRFGGTSRKFRLIIETGAMPSNTTWRIVGGIQMVVETDPD